MMPDKVVVARMSGTTTAAAIDTNHECVSSCKSSYKSSYVYNNSCHQFGKRNEIHTHGVVVKREDMWIG